MLNKEHDFLNYKKLQNRTYIKKFSHRIHSRRKQQSNPVYKLLKTQKLISTIFQNFVIKQKKEDTFSKLNSMKTQKTHQRLKTQMSQKSKAKVQVSQKIDHLSNTIRDFDKSMDGSRKRFNILSEYHSLKKSMQDKFNNLSESDSQRQQNNQLIKVCQEEALPRKTVASMVHEAQNLMQYRQPRINRKHQKQFMQSRRKDQTKILLMKPRKLPQRKLILLRQQKIKTMKTLPNNTNDDDEQL